MEVGNHGGGDEEEGFVRRAVQGCGVGGDDSDEVHAVTQDVDYCKVDDRDCHFLASAAFGGYLNVSEHEVVNLADHERQGDQNR